MNWDTHHHFDTATPAGLDEGIFADTPIATPVGWRPAGGMVAGSKVMTFDGGVQIVEQVQYAPYLSNHANLWPLLVPIGALGNKDELVLLPNQKVLLESDTAEDLFNDPFALIPAYVLDGWRGISRYRPQSGRAVVQIRFARSQIVYASRGVLLACAGDPMMEHSADLPDYVLCTPAQARDLMACIMAQDAAASVRALGDVR